MKPRTALHPPAERRGRAHAALPFGAAIVLALLALPLSSRGAEAEPEQAAGPASEQARAQSQSQSRSHWRLATADLWLTELHEKASQRRATHGMLPLLGRQTSHGALWLGLSAEPGASSRPGALGLQLRWSMPLDGGIAGR
jgi:hypothetical protein